MWRLDGYSEKTFLILPKNHFLWSLINSIALRKAKIVYNFGLSECNRVKHLSKVVVMKSHYTFFINDFSVEHAVSLEQPLQGCSSGMPRHTSYRE